MPKLPSEARRGNPELPPVVSSEEGQAYVHDRVPRTPEGSRRTEGCFCTGKCKELGYCPYTYGVGWPD